MNTFKLFIGSAALLSMATAVCAADGKPAEQEVINARAECHSHKMQVKEKGSFATQADKDAWEESCYQAHKLMQALYGKSPHELLAEQHLREIGGGADIEAAKFETVPAAESQTDTNAAPAPDAGGAESAPAAPVEPVTDAPSERI